MESWQVPLIGPLAPVIGAIFGALIGAFVTYRLVVKRKALMFRISETEDLTLALRAHHQFIAFRIGDKEMLNLNRCLVYVRNVGNVSIANVTFAVVIKGKHPVCLADSAGGSVDLRREVKIEQAGDHIHPVFNVSVPYLNAKESFEVELYFEGPTSKCDVRCRLEDVSVRIQSGKTAIEEAVDFGRGDHEATMAAYIWAVFKRTAAAIFGIVR
jgi:hypothetical protein